MSKFLIAKTLENEKVPNDVSGKQDFEIVRLAEGDIRHCSDHWRDLKELLLANEPMYPEIGKWVREKVQPGIRAEERVAFVGYCNQKPAVSAVLRKGNDAKICHLRITTELQNRSIGEVFWSMMMLEIRDLAKTVHFTLPETVWNQKQGFFKSFGFDACRVSDQQYRLFDEELASRAAFSHVWQCTLDHIPKLASMYGLGISADNQLLISIKPEFVDRIFSGRKKIELRRRFSTTWIGSKINIYASAPVMRLVGEATIGAVVRGTPEYIWERFQREVGCSREEFDRYAAGAEEMYAIELRDPIQFGRSVPLKELTAILRKQLVAPQSYLTLQKNKNWAKAISVTNYLRGCFRSPLNIITALRDEVAPQNPFSAHIVETPAP